MRLLRAELTRLFARRFTQVGVAGVLLLLGAVAVTFAITMHKPTEAERLSARISAEQERDQRNAAYQSCLDAQQPAGTPSTGPVVGPTDVPAPPADKRYPPGFDCRQIIQDIPSDAAFLPRGFNLARSGPGLFRTLGALLALLGFAVGASYVGAEWRSGGLLNLLLWRPRRAPVWLAKLASLLLGLTGVSIALSLLWYGMLWLLADRRGTAGLTGGQLASLALTDVRAVALALVAAAAGYSIASLGRNTATALGVAVGWLVVFEVGARIVLGLGEAVRPERWLLSSYVTAWLNNGAEFADDSACPVSGSCRVVLWTISTPSAALVGAAVLVLVGGISLYAFERRDVT
jgi:hypothetical protein